MAISENKYNNSKSHLRLIALCGIFSCGYRFGIGRPYCSNPMYIAPTFIIKGLMGLVAAIVISVPLTYAIRIKKQK